MKRVLLLVMAAVAAFVLLCACSDDVPSEKDAQSSSAVDSTEQNPPLQNPTQAPDRLKAASDKADAALDAVKTADFGGMSFIVTCTSTEKMFGDQEYSTTLSREMYLRSEKLAQRLNVEFIQTEADGEAIFDGLKKEAEADIVYSHLLLVEASDVGTLSYNKLIGNIGSLPFVDLKKEYYDAEYAEKLSTPTGIWGAYGDACKDNGSLGCVIYNERIRQDLGMDELESLLDQKCWTYDKLLEYSKQASASVPEGSVGYGTVCADTSGFLESAFVAAKMDSVYLSGNELILNDNTKLGDELVECVRALVTSDSYYVGGEERKSAEKAFFDGEALFYTTTLSSVEKIYNMKDVWGLMPIPSVKEGEEYSAPLSSDSSIVCFPASATDTDLVGIMIESLFASSYEILDAAFFDTYLHSYVRNEKTLDTLLDMLDARTVDFAVCYAEEFDNYNKGSLGAFFEACLEDKLYSTIFKQNKTAAQRSLRYVK